MNASSKRPVIKISLSNMEIGLEVVAAIGVLFTVFTALKYWPLLPDTIPTHFGALGKPDAWGPKSSLLMLPIVNAALYLMITILNRFPQIWNFPVPVTEENAPRLYGIGRAMSTWLKAEVVWLFAYIEWASIQVALGKEQGLGVMLLPVMLVTTFGTLGIYIYKMYKAK